MTKAISSCWKNRSNSYGALNTMRLVLSLLDGVDDVGQISSLLHAVKPIAHASSVSGDSTTLSDDATPPDEFARLLKLAGVVSEGLLRELTSGGPPVALVLIVIPALRSVYDDEYSPAAVAAMQEACSRLQQSLPVLHQLFYNRVVWRCSYRTECEVCIKVKRMLASANQRSMKIDRKIVQAHLQGRIDKATGLGARPSTSDPSKVVLCKVVRCNLYIAAVKALAQLEDVVVRGWVEAKTGQFVSH